MSKIIQTKRFQITHLNDVAQGIFETNPTICGNWKKSWVMQLKRKGTYKMPRGFRATSSKSYVEHR